MKIVIFWFLQWLFYLFWLIDWSILLVVCHGTEAVLVTPLRRTLAFLPNTNVLAATSKGIWVVKLCSNKILQLLTRTPTNTGVACVLYVSMWLCFNFRSENSWNVCVLSCATVEEFHSDVVWRVINFHSHTSTHTHTCSRCLFNPLRLAANSSQEQISK